MSGSVTGAKGSVQNTSLSCRKMASTLHLRQGVALQGARTCQQRRQAQKSPSRHQSGGQQSKCLTRCDVARAGVHHRRLVGVQAGVVALLHDHKGDGRAVAVLQLQARRRQLQAGEAVRGAGDSALMPAPPPKAHSGSSCSPDLQGNPLLTTLQLSHEIQSLAAALPD